MARSLVEMRGERKGPRDPRGLRYPLVPVLTLCLVAILAGQTTLAAIAPFGRLRKHWPAHALGFRGGNSPAATEHKAALRLRGALPTGRWVVTADAMFTHPLGRAPSASAGPPGR
ncbi:MAG TPA: transposase family protein [Urbifossiella sp.]|jgi:hypothetical protein|nr:transposase family protein [Urbifossiella sp.]